MKHLLAIIFTFALVISSFATSINAASVEDAQSNASGALEATDEQMQYWASQDKDALCKAYRTENEVLAAATSSTSWIYTSRNFYYYGQETNYSCGPACVKMALRNITGTAYAESAIRAGCKTTATDGTYLSDMVSYINSMQSYNYYIARYKQTKDTMKNELYNGITIFDSPPIVGLKETTSNGWHYNLSGHFVTIFCVTSTKTTFAVTDPWSGYIGDAANRDIMMSVDNLYDSYNAVNIGYMY